MIVIPTQAYPLAWPAGVSRTRDRRESPFFKPVHSSAGVLAERRRRDAGDGIKEIRHQLGLAKAITIVISSNLPLRSDGFPRSDGPQNPGGDVGVAVYWTRRRFASNGASSLVPYCMPCDRWNRIADNLYAIAKSIEALRGMERWGCVSVEQAFAGFAALPPGETPDPSGPRPWRDVLGEGQPWPDLANDELFAVAKARHRRLIQLHHTDVGGDQAVAAELNAALDAAEAELARSACSMLIRLTPNEPVASMSPMTDSEVNDAVRNAQRIYKSSVTRANERYKAAVDKAVTFFGDTDVERAARENAILRAGNTLDSDVRLAAERRAAVLANLREQAGQWADLVPEVA